MNRVMGVVAVLLLVAVSCGDNGNPQSSSEGQFLAIVSGDAQEVESGAQLPLPLTVLMTDEQGRPVAGRRIDFSVVDGDAELSVAVATTDESGRVTTVLTMGDKVGEVRVRAQAFGSGEAVIFTATAGPPGLLAQAGSTAGPDTVQAHLSEDRIVLDGSLSSGRTGGELLYHWSQVLDQEGAKDVSVIGTLSDNHSPTASRVSFSRTEGRGLYVFTLQVEDRESGFRSDVDTLYVLVTSTPPEVSILEPPAYWRWDYR